MGIVHFVFMKIYGYKIFLKRSANFGCFILHENPFMKKKRERSKMDVTLLILASIQTEIVVTLL